MAETKTSAVTTTSPCTTTTLRTHTCDELRIGDVGKEVTLYGWCQSIRDINHFAFVDLRDRYGITQIVFNNPGSDDSSDEAKGLKERYEAAQKLGREFVITVTGKVAERQNKNKNRNTGDIEILATKLSVVNASKTPPFLIEDKTDALEGPRMKFRYLDIRRNPVKEALILRHKVTTLVRNFLSDRQFIEVETPVLIKSTPEGARDFVVPSRMNPGQFYALPQSPQTFKQILMVAGLDRYFQIVKCFRDEELRADRQPEFTQIDCEMSFVSQQDVLDQFEGLIRHMFKTCVNHEFAKFQCMQYSDAMKDYGIDKPDLRYGMKLKDLTAAVKGKDFKPFEEAELVVGIVLEGVGKWGNKKIKALDKVARSQQIGAGGLFWVKCTSLEEGKVKIASSIKKCYDEKDFAEWAKLTGAKDGDLIAIFAGPETKTRDAMGKFRHEMGTQLGLRNGGFCGLWVVDFPLLEWDEDAQRWTAMHHPFTQPKVEDLKYLDKSSPEYSPGKVRADAYDMVINGVEVGGGSIRIHDRAMQEQVFEFLGFTKEAAEEQFGFLMGAFEYGAPPHGGLAFGLDRLCTILGGRTSIRDYIAFPKNNRGQDMMINSPSIIAPEQLEELKIKTDVPVEAADEKDSKQ